MNVLRRYMHSPQMSGRGPVITTTALRSNEPNAAVTAPGSDHTNHGAFDMSGETDTRKIACGKVGSVVIEGPDGALRGRGDIIASAAAYRVRPQDCAPRMRRILFGKRS